MSQIKNFKEITSIELDQMDRDSTLFILPISLMEEHGPHLPLGTDLYISEHFAILLADRISNGFDFHNIVLLPGIPIGAGGFELPGTISSSAQTVENLIVDYGRHLARYGFKYGIITNGHAGRDHMQALAGASEELANTDNFKMVPIGNRVTEQFLTGKLLGSINTNLAEPLTNDQMSEFQKDGHGGWWETSAMLYFRPDLVRPSFKDLPLKTEIDEKGYLGHPAIATREFAEATINAILDCTISILGVDYFRAFCKKNDPSLCNSATV